jgi:hypothetical protein
MLNNNIVKRKISRLSYENMESQKNSSIQKIIRETQADFQGSTPKANGDLRLTTNDLSIEDLPVPK